MNASDSLSFTGYIYDAQTNKPLIGAAIFVMGTNLGASTDLSGKFVIDNIPFDSISFKATYIAHLPGKGSVILSGTSPPTPVYIFLAPIPLYGESYMDRYRTYPKEWKRVERDNLSFSIPQGLTDSLFRGASQARFFWSDTLEVQYNEGWGVDFRSNFLDFSERHTIVACRLAVLKRFVYEPHAKFPFLAVLEFDHQLTLWVAYKNRKDGDDALRILYSVSFP